MQFASMSFAYLRKFIICLLLRVTGLQIFAAGFWKLNMPPLLTFEWGTLESSYSWLITTSTVFYGLQESFFLCMIKIKCGDF